jgi:invasion protein IalB
LNLSLFKVGLAARVRPFAFWQALTLPIALTLALTLNTAIAQVQPQPKIFGSWSTECKGEGKQKRCFASQLVAQSPTGNDVVLGVTIGKLKENKNYAMSFRFSKEANQAAGIGFKLEPKGLSAKAPIQSCDAKVCETKIEINTKFRQELKGKKMMAFAFFDRNKQQITYPVRLDGIENAIKDLEAKARKR